MVQTPGDIKSKDAVVGGETLSFEVSVSIIDANIGTIPVFVVPTGEAYRAKALRIVCAKAASDADATLKLTAGSADLTTAVALSNVTVGAVLTPAILTTNNVDILTEAVTLNIVTVAGTTVTAGEHYVRIDLVRVSNNM